MFKKSIMVAAAALAMAGSAQAALVQVNSEADFVAKLVAGTKAVEDLESFFPGDSAGPTGLKLNFGGAAQVATLMGPDAIFVSEDDFGQPIDNAGRKAHDGIAFWQGGSQPFELVFAQAIQAFGFWGSDIGDYVNDCQVGAGCPAPTAGVLKIEFFTHSGDATAAYSLSVSGSSVDGSELFWGFFDASGATYEKVRFTNLTLSGLNNVADGQGFDTFMIGAVEVDTNPPTVPEPGMLALAGVGLMAMARRRRR